MAELDIDVTVGGTFVPPTVIPLSSLVTSTTIYYRQCFLMGWALYNTSTTDIGAVVLFDGFDSTGSRAGTFTIPMDDSSVEWFGGCGLYLQSALHATVISGTMTGAFYIRKI